ncbi:MAG: glycosyltransferase family 2 protein [Clostridium sp.]|nr:glycosyltransferase family 2 protein [Clostridium sp.]
MKNPKVSIITPLFQSEKYIQRYIDSIIAQNYDNIELILVNDGCTDNTDKIVEENRSKLEGSGINLVYIKQENKGIAGAVETGLKVFNGKYLMWVDYDDILFSDYIKTKVDFMEKNPDCKMCISPVLVVFEDDIDTIVGVRERKIKNNQADSLFFDLIIEKSPILLSICHFIDAEAFLTVNPKREIYHSRIGQNWQILLPMAYNFKAGYIDKPLAKYVVRSESVSHARKNMSIYFNNCKKILINTLKSIEMPEKERLYYINLVNYKYRRVFLSRIFKIHMNFRRKIFSLKILGWDFDIYRGCDG